jgi:hypothetical protein
MTAVKGNGYRINTLYLHQHLSAIPAWKEALTSGKMHNCREIRKFAGKQHKDNRKIRGIRYSGSILLTAYVFIISQWHHMKAHEMTKTRLMMFQRVEKKTKN